MKTNKKKIIVLCSMVALLIVTGTLNFALNRKLPGEGGGGDNTTPTFFASFRTERDSLRAQEFLILDATIQGNPGTEEAATAAARKVQLTELMEFELTIEGLIKAKNFEDAVVTMSTNNINVIVKHDQMTQQDAAQIFNIIVEQTSYTPKQIILTPYSV